MLHDVTVEGRAFRLRPIGNADAELVVKLRSDPLLNRYIHASSASVGDQIAWFEQYYQRAGDYYFVVERLDNGRAEGLISVYDIDEEKTSAEWGRWLLRPGSLGAVESAWMIYRAAFEVLGLESVVCRTVADNVQVVSFHDSCGITARSVLPSHFQIDGRSVDAIEHRVDRQSWSTLSERLEKLASMTARRITRD